MSCSSVVHLLMPGGVGVSVNVIVSWMYVRRPPPLLWLRSVRNAV